MSYLIDIAITPVGTGSTSVSSYVKVVLEVLRRRNLKYFVAPSMTTFEIDDLNSLGEIVKEIHDELVLKGAMRIVTLIKIDDRRDKENSIDHKLNAIK